MIDIYTWLFCNETEYFTHINKKKNEETKKLKRKVTENETH